MKYAVVINHITVLPVATVIIMAAVMTTFTNKVLLQKLTHPHLVKELSTFYETQTAIKPIIIKQQQPQPQLIGDMCLSRS
jgi:hypothetical protein